MSVFPSLPDRATLEHLFSAFPAGAQSLMKLHDDLLRTDGPLTVGQRELIAAYVSSLNACEYCFGAHRTMALAFGVDADLIDALIQDFDAAPLDPLMRAILSYARKVTVRDSVLPSDIRAIIEAGGTEEMANQALMVTALYNFMNRLGGGAGLSAKLSYTAPTNADLERRRNGTYTGWGIDAGFIGEG
ncbi:MAG TPA: peroxidase [Hyphomonadaceae bacterium]|nr:peroxidase [Hyphomonadaceae bacterium]